LLPDEEISRTILTIRGHRVLLDAQLAQIYGVETRVLNQAVRRNAQRFPNDFRFQLTAAEAAFSRSQLVILKPGRGRNMKFLPYAFTEHGAIMAAAVLNSHRAIEMSIYVVRAFVQLHRGHALGDPGADGPADTDEAPRRRIHCRSGAKRVTR
jgi:hypothetical protein